MGLVFVVLFPLGVDVVSLAYRNSVCGGATKKASHDSIKKFHSVLGHCYDHDRTPNYNYINYN